MPTSPCDARLRDRSRKGLAGGSLCRTKTKTRLQTDAEKRICELMIGSAVVAQRQDAAVRRWLFPDAETAENDAKEFFRVGLADHIADCVERGAQFFGNEFRGEFRL